MMAQPRINRVYAGVPSQNILTPQEKRGKQIYVLGTSPSGNEILAYLGDASLEVSGSAMPCANCHGLNGQGKPEGGVTPSNLSWEALTKPYGITHSSGRKHPPYTERALELAIARGLDPAGNKLLNVMPRYQLSREEMKDLIAYLKRLGKDIDPGVNDSRIVIATILPGRSDLAGISEAIKAVTKAYFDEVNSKAGIYNRKIELKFIETADSPAITSANVRRFIQDEQVFAITGAFTAGADRELATLMNEMEVPLVGPLTLYPQVDHPLNRHVFYLLSGMDGQARALVNFALQKLPDEKPGVAIVYPVNELTAPLLEAIRDQCQKKSCGAIETYSYETAHFDAAAAARKLSQMGRNIIFFLGKGDEGLALMKQVDELHLSPILYLPGAAIGKDAFDAPLSFSNRIFLSFPTSPADQTTEGIEEFRALAAKYKLPSTHVATQLSAFGAAKILVEGLKRTGKDLSRQRLIESLEGLNQFATGVTPVVTYGPNRRIGAMGAYVVTIDIEKKQYVPVSSWINSN